MKIQNLRLYPVAGMLGEDVDSLVVTKKCIEGNRVFCLVKTSQIEKWLLNPDAGFPLRMTQAGNPELVLFQARSIDGKLELQFGQQKLKTGLSTKATTTKLPLLENLKSLENLDPKAAYTQYALPIRVSNRSSNGRWGVDCGDEVAAFLSTALNTDCRLFQAVNTNKSSKHHYTWYSELHLVNTASVKTLSAEVSEDVVNELFRYDVLIDAEEAFIENSWRAVQIHDTTFSCGPCERCGYMAVDQVTGQRSHQNIVVGLVKNHDNSFGVYLQPDQEKTVLHVSDELSVVGLK